MCGILGHFTTHKQNRDFSAGLHTLLHRGPDNTGLHSLNIGEGFLQLGHQRLSILDLSEAGNQPMKEDGVTLIYNGEVYNYKELRSKYLQNVRLKSNSDTEVILHLYLKLGPNFVSELNGDFAIAIADERNSKLWLYRDRFGVKPLYIYQNQGEIAFGSEIKAFKALGLSLSLDRDEVNRYWVYKYTPGQKTLFKEVRRQKPGTYTRVDLKDLSFEEKSYWELDYSTKYTGTYTEAKEIVRNLIFKSIERRLISDVPIANYLSGGLDSSILALHLKDGDHTHFCAVKNKSDLKAEGTSSDGYYAKLLAKKWGLNLHEIEIGKNELSKSSIKKAVYACDDLIADGSAIPAMLIAEQAAQDYKVVLSGMGADEIFYGYNGHFLFQLNSFASKIPGAKAVLSPILKNLKPGQGSFKAYKRYLKKWGDNMNGPYSAARSSIVGDAGSAVLLSGQNIDLDYLFADFISKDISFENLQAFEMENFLVKNNHYLDRTSMAYGLESRVPYLDHELVSFVASLPSKWKMDWKLNSKKILKDAYKHDLPDFITKRRKAGFGMPLRSLLLSEDLIGHLLDRDYLGDMNLIDMDVFDQLLINHRSGVQDQSALIFSVIAFQYWHLQMFEDAPTEIHQSSLITG